MDWLRQYLMSVLAASLICALVTKFIKGQAFTAVIVRLTASLFLAVSVFSPLLSLELKRSASSFESWSSDAQSIIAEAQLAAESEAAAIIKEKTQAYILDKAAAYGVNIQVSVELSDSTENKLDKITIQGDVSPYMKQRLQNEIASELGVPKEKQLWI